jgi:hypothetical protein
METTDDLTGSYVLVNPDLYYDPVAKQGNIGILTFADTDNDEFYVSFGKDTALYAGDSLLVLKKPNAIDRDMMGNIKNLEKEHIKDLLRINMLAATGMPKDQKTALEMASANEVVRSYALESLEDKLAREQQVSANQNIEMSAGRGR